MNFPGNHGHSLGLSIGATNLAGTRDGQAAVLRPAELTLHGQRLTGFVDRVGDPVPLVAPDGSKYRSEELLADALGAMAHAVTGGVAVSDVAVTVPAHWHASAVDTLRKSLRGRPRVVSDATAALTALRANPGLPMHGVVVLCDFGGSGTSITLANAARDFSPVGETVRFPDFSGDRIDQALLTHVFTGLVDADPAGTAMVGSLVRLRDECRRAKERLSAETATAVAADLPRHRADIRVTRTELEDLMQAPLAEFLAVLDETLDRYGVPAASVAAVATVGGGARIPLITQRLSEHLRAPVVTTPHPQLTAAEGAALIAHRGRVVDAATALTPTAPAPAVAAAAATATVAAAAQATALAWSEDDVSEDVLPYNDVSDPRPEVHFHHEDWQDDAPPRRSPLVLFALSAVAAAIAAGVFGITLLSDSTTTPVDAAATATSSAPPPAASAPLPAPPAPQAPQQVTTVVVQKPAPRYQAPRTQAPVTHQSPVVTTEPTPETPPTTPDPTPPPTPPTPPPTSPNPPPIDPGPGDGGTGTGTPPIDPGPGNGGTGTGTGTGTGGTGTGTSGSGTGTGTGTDGSATGTGTDTGGMGTGTGGTSTAPQE